MKEAPVKTKKAYADYEKLLEVLRLGRMAGALLGQQLYRLYADRSWQQAIGEGCSWEEFLKMPEVNLDKREATRSMEIYEEFCIKRGYSTEVLADAGTKTLHYLLPMVKKGELEGEKLEDLLKTGASLPQKSFKEALYDAKNPGAERHYEFVIMRRCVETNNLQRVHDITSDQIVDALKSIYRIDLTEKLMPEII